MNLQFSLRELIFSQHFQLFSMRVALVALGLLWATDVSAQNGSSAPAAAAENLHYVVEHTATLYRDASKEKPYLRLGFREPLVVSGTAGEMYRVHTQDGAHGYVDVESVSNIWILVSKRQKRQGLYRGLELIMEVNADFGYNAYSDKVKRGSEGERDHWRTPEGVFYVVRKNRHSQFYRAFLLNYPNAEDAWRGLNSGLISQREHDAIMEAERLGVPPPMNTTLGGMIEIHGDGTGLATNWTQGCVAVRNQDMDALWMWVAEGTPVVIEK